MVFDKAISKCCNFASMKNKFGNDAARVNIYTLPNVFISFIKNNENNTLSRNIPRCGILDRPVLSEYKIEMDPCRNTMFCDQGTTSPINKDFGRMSAIADEMKYKLVHYCSTEELCVKESWSAAILAQE